jgi:DNA modification methylase
MATNKLILGDCLNVLQSIPDKSVDLIYADPPFFSNRDFEILWGDEGEKRSFEDRFAGGIDHYISWLKVRVRQMKRILKDTGAIFLHCDWHANANIRVDVLDNIFGRNNFINEIIWQKIRSSKQQASQFGNSHDTIYFYSKSAKFTFNRQFIPLDAKRLDTHYNNVEEETGRIYQLADFTQAGQGTAKKFGDKILEPPRGKHWIWTQEKIDEGMENRQIIFTSGGRPRVKRYLDESKGNNVEDIWIDIAPLNSQAKERIGYPTQKPEALLQRIIECGTDEGDVFLDPFVGGGTSVAVANKLNRKWIGIDQSVMAIKVTETRLKNRQNMLFEQPFEVLIPTYDYEKLLKLDGKEAEIQIVEAFGGIPNLKGGKDLGIDGHTQYGTPIQVKKWKKSVGRDELDKFITAIPRDDKGLFEKNKKEGQICGFLIGFDFSKDLINEVSRLGNKENIFISLKYIKDIIPYENPPKVTLTAEELEDLKYQFEAKAESETGIDFYSWDFNHDDNNFRADELMDKNGKQTKKFKEGEHKIAVRAVDKKGLDKIDKVKIKVKKND